MARPVQQLRVPEALRAPASLAAEIATRRDDVERVVRRYVTAPLVDDVVQDAMTRALSQWASFRGDGSLDAWVRGIARHTALDAARSRQRARRRSVRTAPHRVTGVVDQCAGAITLAPDRRAEGRDVRSRLLRALAMLSPDQRDVFVLRVLEERSFPEIADALGIELATAKSRMRYARERLQGEVAGLGDWVTGARRAV